MAHMVEHCVFLGTRSFPTTEHVRKELVALGMSFQCVAGSGGRRALCLTARRPPSADTNAYTDFRNTVYTLGGPTDAFGSGKAGAEGTPEAVRRAMVLLREMAFEATFPEHAVDTERGAVLSEAHSVSGEEVGVRSGRVAVRGGSRARDVCS